MDILVNNDKYHLQISDTIESNEFLNFFLQALVNLKEMLDA